MTNAAASPGCPLAAERDHECAEIGNTAIRLEEEKLNMTTLMKAARTLLSFSAVSTCIGVAMPSAAYTECDVTVSKVWTNVQASNGAVWIHFDNGGAAAMYGAEYLKEVAIAQGTTALVTGRSLRVRYVADNVSCTEVRTDVIGFYLL